NLCVRIKRRQESPIVITFSKCFHMRGACQLRRNIMPTVLIPTILQCRKMDKLMDDGPYCICFTLIEGTLLPARRRQLAVKVYRNCERPLCATDDLIGRIKRTGRWY